MTQLNIFVNPRPASDSQNGYVAHLCASLSKEATVVNKTPRKVGRAIDLLRNFNRANTFVLNWPEDILNLRYGLFQALIFNCCMVVAKLRGNKIVWICHNRRSHHPRYGVLNTWNRWFYQKMAHHILVHATDALENLASVRHKLLYLPHPRYEQAHATLTQLAPAPFDVLIWGSISGYKGIDVFIDAYKKAGQQFSVLIIGKGKDDYIDRLKAKAAGTPIQIINMYINEEQLAGLFEQTKVVLLPYLGKDTFSSGALVHSMNSRKIVIGPRVGNFIDVEQAGGCITFSNYNDLFKKLANLLGKEDYYKRNLVQLQEGMQAYYHAHSWEQFARVLIGTLQQQPDLQHHSKTGVQTGSTTPVF